MIVPREQAANADLVAQHSDMIGRVEEAQGAVRAAGTDALKARVAELEAVVDAKQSEVGNGGVRGLCARQ